MQLEFRALRNHHTLCLCVKHNNLSDDRLVREARITFTFCLYIFFENSPKEIHSLIG